jgi:hypothetical protein
MVGKWVSGAGRRHEPDTGGSCATIGLVCALALCCRHGPAGPSNNGQHAWRRFIKRCSGSGRLLGGQNYHLDGAGAPVLSEHTAIVNDTGAMRVDLLREMGPVMPRGGAPFFGEQRAIQVVSGSYVERPAAGANAPASNAAPQRRSQCWRSVTPQGFMKAAMANNATHAAKVSFTVGGK